MLSHIGLRYTYSPEMQAQGSRHSPSKLLSTYAPGLPETYGRIADRWVIPAKGAQYYPLMRSLRPDGLEVPSPLYVIRNGSRTSIISTYHAFTLGTSPAFWSRSKETLAAVAHIAADIRSGKLTLSDAEMAELAVSSPPAMHNPLERTASGSVEPESATPISRWGRFDGSRFDLVPAITGDDTMAGVRVDTLPQSIAPGTSASFTVPQAAAAADAPVFLRIRGGYAQTGAGLKVAVGDTILWNETFIRIDTLAPENYSANLAFTPPEFTRIVFIPSDAISTNRLLTISNPGSAPVSFDAMQLEHQPHPRSRSIGLGAGQDGPNNYPASEAVRWGGLRTSLRSQWVGEPADTNRFARMDELIALVSSKNPRIHAILEGTPEWAAISPGRLTQAANANRPSTVPPDPEKHAEITEAIIRRYGDRISCYEIWNEADLSHFYRGGVAEYATLFNRITPIIRRLQPKAQIMPSGLAGFQPDFIDALISYGVLDASDMIALHPYAGKSPAWDVPYGIFEGYLYSRGQDIEIFCNESGFPSTNLEWFTPPPQLTYETQRRSLDIAIARLLANAPPKLSVFYSGGDFDHGYGLFTANGTPKLAYSVFSDYASLNGDDTARLDISFVRADGKPVTGIYTAASRHHDGTATIIINPAEYPEASGQAEFTPIHVLVRLPASTTLNSATASSSGRPVPVQMTAHNGWAEISLSVSARTLLQVK